MKHFFFVSLCILLLASCHTKDDPVPEMMDAAVTDELPPGMAEAVKTGAFTSYEHNLMGTALLYQDSLMHNFLRLEKFTMNQGPDVRVYLSKSNNYSKANVLEIARLADGYNDNAINFEVTSDSYSEEYTFVLVYCLKYNSLFGYAELK